MGFRGLRFCGLGFRCSGFNIEAPINAKILVLVSLSNCDGRMAYGIGYIKIGTANGFDHFVLVLAMEKTR